MAPAERKYRTSRRQAVLDAARLEIASNGYAHTTLAAVAGRAQITVTAVYYHFDSKLALMVELVRGIGEEMLATVPAALGEQHRTGDALTAIFDAFAQWIDTHEADARLFFVRAPGVSPEVEQLRRSWTTSVALIAGDHVQMVRPDLDLLTARIVGLAVPTTLEEYAGLRLAGAMTASRLRDVRAAVRDLGLRLDSLDARV